MYCTYVVPLRGTRVRVCACVCASSKEVEKKKNNKTLTPSSSFLFFRSLFALSTDEAVHPKHGAKRKRKRQACLSRPHKQTQAHKHPHTHTPQKADSSIKFYQKCFPSLSLLCSQREQLRFPGGAAIHEKLEECRETDGGSSAHTKRSTEKKASRYSSNRKRRMHSFPPPLPLSQRYFGFPWQSCNLTQVRPNKLILLHFHLQLLHRRVAGLARGLLLQLSQPFSIRRHSPHHRSV
jgi:hypothetical protein